MTRKDRSNSLTGWFSTLHPSTPDDRNIRWVGISFAIVNLVFALRFAVLVGQLPGNEVIPFLLCLGVALIASLLGLNKATAAHLNSFFKKRTSIFEIAIWYVVTASLLKGVFKYTIPSVSHEVGSWHIAVFLWSFLAWGLSYILHHFRFLYTEWKEVSAAEDLLLVRIRNGALLITALMLAGYWFFYHVIRPAPFYLNYDPELAYMFSSIAPFKNLTLYKFIGHPGSSQQLLGSTLYVVTYPLFILSDQPIFEHHVSDPSVFLTTARASLLVMNVATLVLISRFAIKIRDWSDVFTSLSVALLYFAIHPGSISFLTIWSPNAFNFALGTLLMFSVLSTLRSGKELKREQISAFGFMAGVLATFQLYLTLEAIGVGITFFAYDLLRGSGWRKATTALANVSLHSAQGFLIATFVIIPYYPSLIEWVGDLVFHQGLYGRGQPGVVSFETFNTNLVWIWESHKDLIIASIVIVLMLGIALYYQRGKLKQSAGLWSVACGLTVQIALLYLLIAKHPQGRYLLSVAATLPVLLLVALVVIEHNALVARVIRTCVFLLVVLGFAVNYVDSIQEHWNTVDRLRVYEAAIDRFLDDYSEKVGKERKELKVFFGYPTRTPCCARWFGNEYAKRTFSEEIGQICRQELYLNIWGKEVVQPDGVTPLSNFVLWDIAVSSLSLIEARDLTGIGIVIQSGPWDLAFIVPPRVLPLDSDQTAQLLHSPDDTGRYACGVFDLTGFDTTGWGYKIVDLSSWPACVQYSPNLSLSCLQADGTWTSEHLKNIGISENGMIITFVSEQDGVCGIFPDQVP